MIVLPRANKYGAKKTTIDGVVFDSRKEAARYGQLKLLERCGAVQNLAVHPKFPLYVNERLICHYEADFRYSELVNGVWVERIEDCKGVRTRDYLLKKKLLRALYGVDVLET
jgi:hypothetical protein